MTDTALGEVRSAFERIVADPDPSDLWLLQKALLAVGGEEAARARAVAREFHACLRTLASKSASRSASRWGALLGTAAVGSVGLRDLLDGQDDMVERLVGSAVPAALEVGSALQSAQAWEVEAGLIYDTFAWFLSEELWDLSAGRGLGADERRARIDELLDPLLDPAVADGDRARLVVDVFRSVLAARLAPLIAGS